MELNKLLKKLSLVYKLGKDDIPNWAVPMLHREVIFESVKGKSIALSRKRIDQVFQSGGSCSCSSKSLSPEILVIYQKRALDYAEILSCGQSPLCCLTVKRIHSLLFTGCADARRTKYRNRNFAITDNIETPVDHSHINRLMKHYNFWLKSYQQPSIIQLSEILEFAAETHLKLVHIHPFCDGNGRTARVLLNAILRRYRLPYVALPKVRNSEVVKTAIEEGLAGQIQPFCKLLKQLLHRSCNFILQWEAKR